MTTYRTHITLEDLRNWGACDYEKRVDYFAGRLFVTAREVGNDTALPADEKLWVLTRLLYRKSPESLADFTQRCTTPADAAAVRNAAAAHYANAAVRYACAAARHACSGRSESGMQRAIDELVRKIEA